MGASEKESKTETWSRRWMLNSQGCPLSEVLGSTSQEAAEIHTFPEGRRGFGH